MAKAALPSDFADALWPKNAAYSLSEFQALVLDAGSRFYRELPWRDIDDPYAVLVSEFMLQQTQVRRVLGRWERFMGRFSSIDALASASVSDVLAEWQGLGYNRRALALKKLADICSAKHGGCVPRGLDELCSLPGVGPATAAGVLAFAYQKPAIYVETNVRTVFLHTLFPDEREVSDKSIYPLVALSCPGGPTSAGDVACGSLGVSPRIWYYALLDFGSQLKASVGNASRRSAGYSRQSAFAGSRRQKRAELLRIVLAHPEGIAFAAAHQALDTEERKSGRPGVSEELFALLAEELAKEGFFSIGGGCLRAL